MKYLRDKNLDIIFLQETHSTNVTAKLWQTEWGSKWILSSHRSNSRGVAILFRTNLKIKIIKQYCDHEGCYVVVMIESLDDGQQYTLCNLYLPNEDKPKFFKRVFKTLSKVTVENVIIGGDFNLMLNPKIDRHNSFTH